MALNSMSSAVVSLTLSLMLYSSMQFFKIQLASTEMYTILGGFMGSCLFVTLLTAMNNLENVFLDDYFQAKVFPEVFVCLGAAMFSSAMVHRVSVTVCLLFSIVHLVFINKVSGSFYQAPVEASALKLKNKRKKQ